MTENDQITLSVAQLKLFIEANSNIANVNVVSSEQEPVVDNVSDNPLFSKEECDVTAPGNKTGSIRE